MQTPELPQDDLDASRLLSNTSKQRTAPICTVKVRPREQSSYLLGEYEQLTNLRGFSVEFKPDPDPANSIVTQVTNITTAGKHRLFLHIANYGNKTVTATVRQL